MIRMSLILILSVSAVWVNAQKKLNEKDLLELKGRMVGSFSSQEQSKKDSSYFDIRLHMAQVWNERKDGYWLYVEQAVAVQLKKPYRQRIYHVYLQDDSTIVSKVYEMKSPANFIGAWSNPSLLNVLTTDSLIDRQGCALYLHQNADGDYYGTTPGKDCLSSLRGATYATSEALIKKDRLLSWDRGWDATDKQKWGAVKGGYQFIKEP